MPRTKRKTVVPIYESIFQLPVVYICAADEDTSDDNFFQHLYIPSNTMEGVVNNVQTFFWFVKNKLNSDSFHVRVPSKYLPMLIDRLQLNKATKSLALYSLSELFSIDDCAFFRMFVNDVSFIEAAMNTEKFENVIYLCLDDEFVEDFQ